MDPQTIKYIEELGKRRAKMSMASHDLDRAVKLLETDDRSITDRTIIFMIKTAQRVLKMEKDEPNTNTNP